MKQEYILLNAIANSLKSIEKSLSSLAEDTKTKKELNIEIMNKLNGFEKVLTELKEDPFDLNKRD